MSDYTYDIHMPDGSVIEWTNPYESKPYIVLELRRTGNFVYKQWQFKTPSGASNQLRKLLDNKEKNLRYITTMRADESSFVIASPKEMD